MVAVIVAAAAATTRFMIEIFSHVICPFLSYAASVAFH